MYASNDAVASLIRHSRSIAQCLASSTSHHCPVWLHAVRLIAGCFDLQQVRLAELEVALVTKEAEVSALRSQLLAGNLAAPAVMLDEVPAQPQPPPVTRPRKVTLPCGSDHHFARLLPMSASLNCGCSVKA